MVYEVEIKTLLGTKERADDFRAILKEYKAKKVAVSKQLNHYFIYSNDDSERLLALCEKLLSDENSLQLKNDIQNNAKVSVRTRDENGNVYFVAKLSMGSDSSIHGVLRTEIQEKIDMSIAELDQLLINAGLEYQAKWSREREEFDIDDIRVTLDKNAGYGYLAEFEKEVSEEGELKDANMEIRKLMKLMNIEELSQERLDRMFTYYNDHWEEYYGSDNIFSVE